MIIDCHGHVASTDVLPAEFFRGWARNLKRKLALDDVSDQRVEELLLGMLGDDDCSILLREMDEAGIAKVVLLIIDFGFAFPASARSLEEVHELHRRLIRSSERFIVFSGVDPRRGQQGVDFFEKAISDWGFHGLKLYPPCGYSPSSPELFPYYEVCSQYRVPVLTHIGPTSEALSFAHTGPMDLDEAARRFQNVDFILAHSALRCYREAAMLAEFRSNIYLDASGFQDGLANRQFHESLGWLLRSGLHRKLLFGIDWPIHRLFGSQAAWVEAFQGVCRELGASDDELDAMMAGNMLSLLAKRRPAQCRA